MCVLLRGPPAFHNFFSRKQTVSYATHWGKSDGAPRNEMESKYPLPTKTRTEKEFMFNSCLFSFSLNSSCWWLVVFGFVNTRTRTKSLTSPFLLLLLLWNSVSWESLLSCSSALWWVCRAKSSPATHSAGALGEEELELLSPPLLSEASPALPYPPPPISCLSSAPVVTRQPGEGNPLALCCFLSWP